MRTPIIQVNAITAKRAVVHPNNNLGIWFLNAVLRFYLHLGKISFHSPLHTTVFSRLHPFIYQRPQNEGYDKGYDFGRKHSTLMIHLIGCFQALYDKFKYLTALNIFYPKLKSMNTRLFAFYVIKAVGTLLDTQFSH